MRKLFSMLVMGVVAIALAVPVSAAPEKGEQPDRAARFKKMDKNSDGKLTLEEFTGKRTSEQAEMAKKQFTRMDKDKSGDVSEAEFLAVKPRKPKQ